jgi:hypothetical protein
MTHFAQLEFVKEAAYIAKNIIKNPNILEIGSHSVNGEVKNLFDSIGGNYLGIDLCEGPNVDVVANGSSFGDSEAYNIVMACEVFEHNPVWLETFVNMIRVTEPGGIIIFTCASRGRHEHGTKRTDPSHSPGTSSIGWDYYKNLNESDFTNRINFHRHFSFFKFYSNTNSNDLYFIGQKIRPENTSRLKKYNNELEKIFYRIKKESKLKLKTRLRRLPMSIFSYVLPDKFYQNIAIIYERVTLSILSKIRNVF